MDSPHWPLILIEGVLVFGGALAFGWWQLRSVKRDRQRMLEERARQQGMRDLPESSQGSLPESSPQASRPPTPDATSPAKGLINPGAERSD